MQIEGDIRKGDVQEMNIVIKPAAVKELQKYEFGGNQGLRIEAIFVGTCSIATEHYLRIDERREDDLFLMAEGIPVVVSEESQKNLHHTVTLDFNPSLGFKLYSDEETYRYNLRIIRNQ